MGANIFHETCQESSVDEAFKNATSQARYEYGHGGYTGTIAEKGNFKVFDLPEGKTVREVIDAIDATLDGERAAWLPHGIEVVYDDKWGPAVAMRDEHGWHFFGWASS